MSNSVTERLLVALSGGVDSSVAAALLLDQGHEVEGVYVRTWQHEDDLLGDCPGARDLADAERVADALGISFEVVNYVDFYHREVVLPMVNGYADGITPNPDALCNRSMKFEPCSNMPAKMVLMAWPPVIIAFGKVRFPKSPNFGRGRDKNKDQSYFLARITPQQLAGARFPPRRDRKTEGP